MHMEPKLCEEKNLCQILLAKRVLKEILEPSRRDLDGRLRVTLEGQVWVYRCVYIALFWVFLDLNVDNRLENAG